MAGVEGVSEIFGFAGGFGTLGGVCANVTRAIANVSEIAATDATEIRTVPPVLL